MVVHNQRASSLCMEVTNRSVSQISPHLFHQSIWIAGQVRVNDFGLPISEPIWKQNDVERPPSATWAATSFACTIKSGLASYAHACLVAYHVTPYSESGGVSLCLQCKPSFNLQDNPAKCATAQTGLSWWRPLDVGSHHADSRLTTVASLCAEPIRSSPTLVILPRFLSLQYNTVTNTVCHKWTATRLKTPTKAASSFHSKQRNTEPPSIIRHRKRAGMPPFVVQSRPEKKRRLSAKSARS